MLLTSTHWLLNALSRDSPVLISTKQDKIITFASKYYDRLCLVA